MGRIDEGVRLPNRNPEIGLCGGLDFLKRQSKSEQNDAPFTAYSQFVSYSANCYILHSNGCQKESSFAAKIKKE